MGSARPEITDIYDGKKHMYGTLTCVFPLFPLFERTVIHLYGAYFLLKIIRTRLKSGLE